MTPSLLRRTLSRLRPSHADPSTETAAQPVATEAAAEPVATEAAAEPVATETAAEPVATTHRHRRALVVGGAAAALVLSSGGMAVAHAHKVVTLDVDGQVRQVTTFAGAVDGLLTDQEVTVGEHDALTPAAGAALTDGATIVVRHGHRLTVQLDGEQTTVWSTALTADEALGTLEARGEDVRLLPSRSTAGRAELPLDLAVRGRVDVVADGATRTVAAAQDLAGALTALDLEVGPIDRLQVLRAVETGRLTVLLQRVVVTEEPGTLAVDFQTVERSTSALYTGQRRTVIQGVPGVRTQVFAVTRVDGVEESRELVSDELTTAPVDAVVEVGTKARPATPVAASGSVSGDVWAALARCESGGNPKAVSANGKYYGLYQFSVSTWQGVGGAGLPTDASADEQTARAQALQARSGWGQWPACSAKLGLR